MSALGFIETKGLLAAIEGADAMLKAANVRLLEKNLAGGGLVTISIAGEVAAVRAAVDAGVASISRIPGSVLVSEHVIARPDSELDAIIATGTAPATPVPPAPTTPTDPKKDASKAAEAEQNKAQANQGQAQQAAPKNVAVPQKSEGASRKRYSQAQLKKMSLGALRELAHKAEGLSMHKDAIGKADKKALLEALMSASRQTKE